MELDIPYVPSSEKRLKTMVDLAKIQPGEKVVDLGSGDGRVVIALARKGAQAIGYELEPGRAFLGRKKIEEAGLEHNAAIFNENFWEMNLENFDAVTVYGITGIMDRLEEKLQKELKPGARVVSNGFTFPKWKPIKIENGVFLYIK